MRSSGTAGRPRPTVGHHFGSLLQCPQRAWLDYWGSPKDKLAAPAFLFQHQREGFVHEAEMSRRLFPDAVTIPGDGSPEDRKERTLEAIRRGAPSILQAYLSDGDGLGIADVLERSDGGAAIPTYRVGEFKRATSLKTGHLLQGRWDAELLHRLGVAVAPDAFFVLGDGRRRDVSLADIHEVFESCTARLRVFRQPDSEPGPHFARGCITCPWRGVCVPELVSSEHVSLLPGVGREAARRLSALGVHTWRQAAVASDESLTAVGIEGTDAGRLRTAVGSLNAGKPVTRFNLRPSMFSDLTSIALEYTSRSAVGDTQEPPLAICYEAEERVERIPVSAVGGAAWSADLSPLLRVGRLAVYGATDQAVILRLCKAAKAPPPEFVDVFELIESLVHLPLIGLELADVAAYLGLPVPTSAAQRVASVRSIVDWLRPVAEIGTAA